MIIYRCDCCKKDVSEKGDLYEMALYTQRKCDKPPYSLAKIEKEVCADCMHEIRKRFNDYVINGGKNNEC